MSLSKERRQELREDGGDSATLAEWETLLDMADERDRYRALLVEARRGYLKDGTIFAREVDAALEGKHEHQ